MKCYKTVQYNKLAKKIRTSKISTKKPFTAVNGFLLFLFNKMFKNRHYQELNPGCYFDTAAAFLFLSYPVLFYSFRCPFYFGN